MKIENNSKNRTIMIILILAVVVALLAGVSAYMYLSPRKTTVYVFNDSYTAGTPLDESMLTPVQCDSKIVVAGNTEDVSAQFVTGSNINDVLNAGDSLRMDVGDGMPLTMAMLSVSGGSSVEMNLDPAKIAVTVSVNDISAVTNELKEGSRVNIYASGIDSEGITLLFQNMRVLAVIRDDNGTITGVTVEVDKDESLKLIYAANYSTIYLGLVDSTGYEYSEENEPSYVPEPSTDQSK